MSSSSSVNRKRKRRLPEQTSINSFFSSSKTFEDNNIIIVIDDDKKSIMTKNEEKLWSTINDSKITQGLLISKIILKDKEKKTNETMKKVIGIHGVVDKVFGSDTSHYNESFVNKRTSHSSKKGIRIHSCIQHNLVCLKYNSPEYEKNKPFLCIYCDHPKGCRMKKCKKYSSVIENELNRLGLIGIATEVPIQWSRFNNRLYRKSISLESRIDLICVRNTIEIVNGDVLGSLQQERLVIISLKTKSNNEKKCSSSSNVNIDDVRSRIKEVMKLPKTPFLYNSRESGKQMKVIPTDCQENRYQAQLMMENLILIDSYNACIGKPKILTLIEGRSTFVNDIRVEVDGPCKWWWKTLIVKRENDDKVSYNIPVKHSDSIVNHMENRV